MTTRLHPAEHLLGPMMAERFPEITAALGAERDIDRFLMAEPAIALLSELRPDEGLGDTIDEFVAFVHAAWRWWVDGSRTRSLDHAATTALLRTAAEGDPDPAAWYIQIEPRRIWARIDDAESHEPIDGWFSFATDRGRRVVACLGLHQARPGVSVVVAEGPRPEQWRRQDGTAAFAPLMTGGDVAGLASVDAAEELLLLGWNVPAF